MADEKRISPSTDEKQYGSSTGESPPYDGKPQTAQNIVEEKGMRIGEAADMYGDVATAEEYGYVARGYGFLEPPLIKLNSNIFSQSQVPTHSIHRSWWYYWNWSFLRYRKSFEKQRTTSSSSGLYNYWWLRLCSYAMSWRNGYMASVAWCYSSILFSLRGWCSWFCCRMECESIYHYGAAVVFCAR